MLFKNKWFDIAEALEFFVPITEKSARSPKIRFKAFKSMDFPEPVSPVIIV